MPAATSSPSRRSAVAAAGAALLLVAASRAAASPAPPVSETPPLVPATAPAAAQAATDASRPAAVAIDASRPAAVAIAAGLAAFGPRPAGSPAKARSASWLLGQMRRAGLARVGAVPVPGVPGARNLEGVVPGVAGGGEILLTAHYDTVAGSPGAGDDASGCGVAIAAAADLGRTPLAHTVRVVLFDAEEAGLHGARFLVSRLDREARAEVLAAVNLEMLGWRESPGATLLAWGVPRDGRLVQPPAWLAHAALRAGRAVGWPLAMTDPTLPLGAQLLVRSTRPAFATDADPFVRAGLPAVTLSDSPLLALDPAYHGPEDTAERLDAARLAAWTTAVAALVRRLDALGGRPVPEDRYLVAFGRVFPHRDLLWMGFLLWALLVVQDFLARRGAAAPAGGAVSHRRVFSAFPFRLLLIVSVVADPIFAILLWPSALLAFAVPPGRAMRLLWAALGLLPSAAYVALLLWASGRGFVGPWAPPLPGTALAAAALAAFAYLLWRRPAGRPLTASPP